MFIKLLTKTIVKFVFVRNFNTLSYAKSNYVHLYKAQILLQFNRSVIPKKTMSNHHNAT